MIELWKQIFIFMKVDLLYSTVWHPQIDGVSERSNQIVEIVLRYYIVALDDAKLWFIIFSKMSTALNNFIKYNFTIRTFIQVLYGFRIWETLDLLRIDDFDSFTSKVISKAKIITITACSVARNVTITTYSIIIKNAIVGNDSAVNRSRISSLKIVIFVIKKLAFR